jgi:hypothetical protein
MTSPSLEPEIDHNPAPTERPTRIQRWLKTQEKRRQARALKALQEGIYALQQYHSWKQIGFNAPPGSKLDIEAHTKTQKFAMSSLNYFNVVREALGVDLDADEPPPKRHWDAGA